MNGPELEFSDQLHAEKYRGPGESFRESMNRIASALKDSDEHFYEFRDILLDMKFLPGGRIQAAMGSARATTAFNCFLSGTIEDSFISGDGSIMQRATEAAQTMRFGGGIGYDFSTLRPSGDMIRTLQSRSSGPVSFMNIFNAVGQTVCSAGHRRGAQMGVMRVDHPDIEEFIHAKQNNHALTGFNISIAITDEFMNAIICEDMFELRWGGRVYRTVDAASLWEQIMRATWDWADPGVIFIDTINRMNNLWYCEDIVATNPCGEQPLPPFGACLLGSFNLSKFVDVEKKRFNWVEFRECVAPIVRAMDNVIDRTIYPLPEQKQEALNKRRMGLGITALANTAEFLGYPYGSEEFLRFENKVMRELCLQAYEESVQLAIEKGPFPLFVAHNYCEGEFIKKLPKNLQDKIRIHGIRNSHLISLAPTGTISMTADCVSSCIEPVFAYSTKRNIETFDGPRLVEVEDYGYRVFGVEGKKASQVTAEEHLAVLTKAYRWVDSAVSKTCNVPADMPWEEFKNIYIQAWKRGCKGCTTFQVGGKRKALLTDNDDKIESCRIDPETGRKECD